MVNDSNGMPPDDRKLKNFPHANNNDYDDDDDDGVGYTFFLPPEVKFDRLNLIGVQRLHFECSPIRLFHRCHLVADLVNFVDAFDYCVCCRIVSVSSNI